MALRICAVGRVMVSLRRSMVRLLINPMLGMHFLSQAVRVCRSSRFDRKLPAAINPAAGHEAHERRNQ